MCMNVDKKSRLNTVSLKVFLPLYLRKYRYLLHLCTASFWNGRIFPGEGGVVARAGVLLHFLDSLACLFFGGAHFKHMVSTEEENMP